jgi:hypothetical protein
MKAFAAASRFSWAAASLMVWLGMAVVFSARAAGEDQGRPARFNLSTVEIGAAIFIGVNHDDASAGIKVRIKAVLNQHGNLAEVGTRIFEASGAICTALKNGEIDAASVCTEEFLDLAHELQSDTVILETQNHAFTVFPNS